MTAVLRTYIRTLPQNWYTYCLRIHSTFLKTIIIYYIEIPINIYLIINNNNKNYRLRPRKVV